MGALGHGISNGSLIARATVADIYLHIDIGGLAADVVDISYFLRPVIVNRLRWNSNGYSDRLLRRVRTESAADKTDANATAML